ncbi:PREDICTED: ceramide synthase 4-like, partial [Buceros rhinoceros silvestris]|uniref:ceramide synthase 4-like n=1 Tax=Buceros rhinoceros silvestris TaxID=175836 RepID=UPI000528E880
NLASLPQLLRYDGQGLSHVIRQFPQDLWMHLIRDLCTFVFLRMARSLYEWLWQHEFWLPPGITWEDMRESEDVRYPQPRDLLLSIPFALLLVVIRCAFERAIALPLSSKLGVRDKQRPKAQPNPVLETFYSTRCKNPKEGELITVAQQCDLPVRKVERWFRRRRNADRPRLSKKFCEA